MIIKARHTASAGTISPGTLCPLNRLTDPPERDTGLYFCMTGAIFNRLIMMIAPVANNRLPRMFLK